MIFFMNSFVIQSMLALATGFLLDLIVGDPYFLPHPIRLIGKLIEKMETILRRIFGETQRGQLLGGIVLAALVPAVSFAVSWAILLLAGRVHPLLSLAVECVMCYQILAVKALKTESMKVYDRLENGTIGEARKAVSMIVGRDTQQLSAEQVAKATVETIAENTSDGTVAPMLFMAVGGAPLGFLYKAVNTMDSMVGYKNDRYLYFGRAAAYLDDIANFIPARLSGILMIAASALLGMDAKGAARIFWRDRGNHASPNSAQTEAVCAGALQIQLAGDAYYFGKLYPKQTIGDRIRSIENQDIRRANRLLYGTAVLCLLLCMAGMAAFIMVQKL